MKCRKVACLIYKLYIKIEVHHLLLREYIYSPPTYFFFFTASSCLRYRVRVTSQDTVPSV
jgi:hypothetical protein